VAQSDALIVGGGIIGLALAIALRRRGLSVRLLERGEPGQEASHAAGGMLVESALETPPALQPLATASAHMYPEFVRQLEQDSGIKVDYRSEGTLLFPTTEQRKQHAAWSSKWALPAPLHELEPPLDAAGQPCGYLKESSVDPRTLVAAALQAAQKLGVEVVRHSPVTVVRAESGHAEGVSTGKTSFISPVVVNCAGAWARQIGRPALPTRPVKGQMLAVRAPRRGRLRHVIRSPEVYLIPRSDGRIVIGATVEEKGFDKETDAATIEGLYRAAGKLVPALKHAEVVEAWAGLRPGTPDNLPILGETPTKGYFVATGHFRDGILLAPITAKAMAELICGERPEVELGAFGQGRFG
jgi:glycine oxidase